MGHKLLIVNYHYIRESDVDRGIYHITPRLFKRQLELIWENGYKFIALEDLHDAITRGDSGNLHKKSCLITFDDGLRESFEVGNPILESMGVRGVFYVCSSMIGSNKVLDVHKYHYIQSKMSDDEILCCIPSEYIVKMNLISDDVIREQYSWDDLSTGKLKYLINFLLDPVIKSNVIDSLFKLCVKSEMEFASNLYMTQEQIKFLARQRQLGTHGESHTPMTLFGIDDLYREIGGSRRDLESLAGEEIQTISYPYGGECNQRNGIRNCSKRKNSFWHDNDSWN